MIKKNLAVTENSLLSQHESVNFFTHASDNDAMAGIYLSTSDSCALSPDRIRRLIDLVQKHRGHAPDCYLLLELNHKGRVDARLFADAEFTAPMTLNMQEDGDAVVIHE